MIKNCGPRSKSSVFAEAPVPWKIDGIAFREQYSLMEGKISSRNVPYSACILILLTHL